MKNLEPPKGASPTADQENQQESAGHGGKREGAGPKFDQKVWRDGGRAEYIKRELPFKLSVDALKGVLRGQTKEVRAALKRYMSRDKAREALGLLQGVVDADNYEMLQAVVEVARMCGSKRVAQEAHRVVAGQKRVPHGKILDTEKRDKEIRKIKQRAEQTRKRAPPDEVQIEWIRQDREEIVRLMKEQDPDAPVGVAMEPIDPALQFPPAVQWPRQQFKLMCVDPDCKHAAYEHIHCRLCGDQELLYGGPDPNGPYGEEVLGLCERCFWELVAEKRKSKKK